MSDLEDTVKGLFLMYQMEQILSATNEVRAYDPDSGTYYRVKYAFRDGEVPCLMLEEKSQY